MSERIPFPDFPIVFAEPNAPPRTGDRWPCHWFSPEVEWPAAVGPVLRRDRPDASALRAADARARAAANDGGFRAKQDAEDALAAFVLVVGLAVVAATVWVALL